VATCYEVELRVILDTSTSTPTLPLHIASPPDLQIQTSSVSPSHQNRTQITPFVTASLTHKRARR
jgi:hypothetical protein